MTSTETLQTWRGEIAAELGQLEGELVEAQGAVTDAEAAYSTASAQAGELQALASRGVSHRDGMAGSLYGRLQGARGDALREVSRARGAARARVRSLEESVAGRRLALQQIDRAIASDRVTPLRREIVKRPAAKPVEFDTIAMPREAV